MTTPCAGETSLADLVRAKSAELFFAGLLSEFAHCAASNEIDHWEQCAHAIVSLLASSGRNALATIKEAEKP